MYSEMLAWSLSLGVSYYLGVSLHSGCRMEKPNRLSRQWRSSQIKDQIIFKASPCRMGKPCLNHYSVTASTPAKDRTDGSKSRSQSGVD